MKKIGMFFVSIIAAWSLTANAATVTSLYGDKDCFGTGGACVEDGSTWLPGGWGAVTQTATDPVWTDKGYSGATAQWTHSFAAGSYSSASITIKTLGMADIYGPYDVLVDGVVVGSMPLDGFGHILVDTFTFGLDVLLLADGLLDVSISTVTGDLWAIDYSEVTAEMGDLSPVPVPAAVWLFGTALAGFAGFGRFKKKTA